MTTTTEIQNAVTGFTSLIKLGWETDLAFNCQYDLVYEIIGEETFLNMCQSAVKEQQAIICN